MTQQQHPRGRLPSFRALRNVFVERVEVIIVSLPRKWERGERYPLRGKPFRYMAPFDSVAENDWNVLQ
jgi:hypothetical protein